MHDVQAQNNVGDPAHKGIILRKIVREEESVLWLRQVQGGY